MFRLYMYNYTRYFFVAAARQVSTAVTVDELLDPNGIYVQRNINVSYYSVSY